MTGRPYAPWPRGASPLELSEALATAWRLHARLCLIARTRDPGDPVRAENEARADGYRAALLPLDHLLTPTAAVLERQVARAARDALARTISAGRDIERAMRATASLPHRFPQEAA